MRVLVACEFSGVVRDAFAAKGHEAVSCDLTPSDSPGPHIEADVLDILDQGWDLMVAHPPCTYLCRSGIHWNKVRPDRQEKTDRAIEFAKSLWDAPIERICIENPVGLLSTAIGPPSQYIQPHDFKSNAKKKTGLWLKNLPYLKPTGYVEPRWVFGKDKKTLVPRWGNQGDCGYSNLTSGPDRSRKLSITYSGVAEAMADQWGGDSTTILARTKENEC